MSEVIAKAVFDCVDLRGNSFQTTVEIGAPEAFTNKSGSNDYRCYVAVLPLSIPRDFGACGTDSLMALGMALDNARTILRTFVQLGGKVYLENTKTPVDLSDVRFAPVNDHLINPEFRA